MSNEPSRQQNRGWKLRVEWGPYKDCSDATPCLAVSTQAKDSSDVLAHCVAAKDTERIP